LSETAVENEGILDKEITSYDDIFDAFRLAATAAATVAN